MYEFAKSKYELIRNAEDPRLHVPSKKIGKPTNLTTQQIVNALVGHANTLGPSCVGLAAPQIGVNKQVFIVKHNGVWVAMANPRIVEHGEDYTWGTEACISHPGVTAVVARWSNILVVSEDVQSGREWRLRFVHNEELDRSGFYPQLYRVIQHEIDHLHGVLFVDKGPDAKDYLIQRPGQELLTKAFVKAQEGPAIQVDI